MKKHIWMFGLICLLAPAVFAGCTASETRTESSGTAKGSYEQITPDQAKELMDNEVNYILLDVRTEEEYRAGHIEGAVLIPDYEIGEKAAAILADKEQLILVYCRSGRRSKNAAGELAALGYTNIKEFGGILDWEYETVTEPATS